MDKKLLSPKSIRHEDNKLPPVSRNELKNKPPHFYTRRSSKAAIEAISAVITDRLKNSREIDLITNALNKHFIFTSLSNDNRMGVIFQMKLYSMGPREIVFEQNAPGSNFYIVATGKLDIFINGKQVNILGPGDSFGELALLHEAPRSASVYTVEKVTM